MSIKHLKPRTAEEIANLPDPPKLDYSKIYNIEFEGIDYNDYPDFCDAYIVSADYYGRELSENEIDELNANNRDIVYEKLMSYLY